MLSSSPTIAKITIKGSKWIIARIPPAESIVQPNPANIFRRQWPLIILANKRNAKLTTLKL